MYGARMPKKANLGIGARVEVRYTSSGAASPGVVVKRIDAKDDPKSAQNDIASYPLYVVSLDQPEMDVFGDSFTETTVSHRFLTSSLSVFSPMNSQPMTDTGTTISNVSGVDITTSRSHGCDCGGMKVFNDLNPIYHSHWCAINS